LRNVSTFRSNKSAQIR